MNDLILIVRYLSTYATFTGHRMEETVRYLPLIGFTDLEDCKVLEKPGMCRSIWEHLGLNVYDRELISMEVGSLDALVNDSKDPEASIRISATMFFECYLLKDMNGEIRLITHTDDFNLSCFIGENIVRISIYDRTTMEKREEKDRLPEYIAGKKLSGECIAIGNSVSDILSQIRTIADMNKDRYNNGDLVYLLEYHDTRVAVVELIEREIDKMMRNRRSIFVYGNHVKYISSERILGENESTTFFTKLVPVNNVILKEEDV